MTAERCETEVALFRRYPERSAAADLPFRIETSCATANYCGAQSKDLRCLGPGDWRRDEMMRRHTGHGIGLEGHEQPFCDLGDDTEVMPGMVFSVEPGLYVPGVAGFRPSDTIFITEDGCEIATFYPRDLDSLIVQI